MAEWRWNRGWTEEELEACLAAESGERLNFTDEAADMVPENGWNHVSSHAVIGRERPGPPEEGSGFAHAREAVERLEFSDPRIVVGHFDRDSALLRRVVLLELKSAGLRFLCPVRIGAVRNETSEQCTRFGFSFETLEGHIEAGREWFLLTKHHDTGNIEFQIAAAWRTGEFPNAWSYAGFQLFGRRYQRAWHRLAHLRLRHVMKHGPLHAPEGEHLIHSGAPLPSAPVQFHATRAHLPFKRLHDEGAEQVRRDRLLFTAGFAALAGTRSSSPHAFLSHALRRSGRKLVDPVVSALSSRLGSTATKAALLGEMAADKTEVIGDRTDALPLVGRALSGALVGHTLASQGRRSRLASAGFGAAVAVASAYASHAARKQLMRRMSGTASGLIEDALVLAGGALLTKRVLSVRHPAEELDGPSPSEA